MTMKEMIEAIYNRIIISSQNITVGEATVNTSTKLDLSDCDICSIALYADSNYGDSTLPTISNYAGCNIHLVYADSGHSTGDYYRRRTSYVVIVTDKSAAYIECNSGYKYRKIIF